MNSLALVGTSIALPWQVPYALEDETCDQETPTFVAVLGQTIEKAIDTSARLLQDELQWWLGTGGTIGKDILTVALDHLDFNLSAEDLENSIESKILAVDEMLAAIRSTLSLNVSELARVLKVERPTIYAWMNSESLPHRENQSKLDRLFAAAQIWLGITQNPMGNFLKSKTRSGVSFLELLVQEFPLETLQKRMVELSREMTTKSRVSVRDRALRHGIDLTRISNQQEHTNQITGKRIDVD